MKRIMVLFAAISGLLLAQPLVQAEIKSVNDTRYALEIQNTGAQIKVLVNGKELYNDTVENSTIAQRKLTSVVQEGKNNIVIVGKIVNDSRPDVKIRVIKSKRRHISFIYEYKWDKKNETFKSMGSFDVN